MHTLVALNRDCGMTIVVVTHEADIAGYANRVVTMRDGRIVSDVRPSKPAPPRTIGRDATLLAAGETNAITVRWASALWAFGLMILAAAMQAIARNQMRSALTMLGVFIGVAALIVMVAVGRGANEAVRKQIESLGTNLLLVQVKGVPLRVIAQLAVKGQTAFGMDQDDVVMVPFTTGERKVLGVAHRVHNRRRSTGLICRRLIPMGCNHGWPGSSTRSTSRP